MPIFPLTSSTEVNLRYYHIYRRPEAYVRTEEWPWPSSIRGALKLIAFAAGYAHVLYLWWRVEAERHAIEPAIRGERGAERRPL